MSYLVERFGQSELAQTAMTNIEKLITTTSPEDAFIPRKGQSFFATCDILVRRMFVNLIRNSNGMQIRLFQLLLFSFLLWAFMGKFGMFKAPSEFPIYSSWWHAGDDQNSVQNRIGYLYETITGATFMGYDGSLSHQ